MVFLGLLAYLFFFFIRVQDWWKPMLGVPVDAIVVSIIVISLIFSNTRVRQIFKYPQCKFLILFVLTVFLSNAVHGNMDAAVEWGVSYAKYAILFLTIGLSLNSVERLKFVRPYLAVLVGFIAYQGILMWVTGTNWSGETMYWAHRIRWVGLFNGANSLILAFIIVIPFLLEYLFGDYSLWQKTFAAIGMSLVTTAFYMANSRGGFLALLIVLVFFVSMKLKNLRGVGLALIVGMLLLFFAAPSRMGEIDDPENSTRGRIEAWSESIDMVKYVDPVFGVGKGQFTKYVRRVAHNAFMQQFAETGLLGAYFWLGVIYASMKGMAKIMSNDGLSPEKVSLYRGYLLGVIGILAIGMFISEDHELMFIWLAVCTAIQMVENIEISFDRSDIAKLAALEITLIVLVYVAVNAYNAVYS